MGGSGGGESRGEDDGGSWVFVDDGGWGSRI